MFPSISQALKHTMNPVLAAWSRCELLLTIVAKTKPFSG